MNPLNREGYWVSPREPKLPTPRAQALPWTGQDEFLRALDSVQERCRVDAYRGSSRCRICEQSNGHEEYTWTGWQWPAGYRHYIAEHNVRPSLAFQEMILNQRVDGKAL